ncbi:MAG: cation-transporting P-type ATPase [Actinomycetota bacterium]|nr:cation-transporting P-type ATPase [Actinomycetota bacterium]
MEIQRLSNTEVYTSLDSEPRGLSDREANLRLERYGPNEIREIKGPPLINKFLANFYHLFAVLLWVGAGLSFVAGLPELGWAIIAVIIINALFSFWQEHKAEKATEALKRLLPSYSKVLREGEVKEILATALVPGDVLILEEGDNISADARLVQAFEMRTVNATLTGESAPVRRTSAPIPGPDIALVESPNIVFAGTNVATGSGRAVAYATGDATEFGKIAGLTQQIATDLSPLQKEMVFVTRVVAVLAVGLGTLFFVLGSELAGLSMPVALLFAIGIIVANVPEGLLPTVTLSLAFGVERMVKKNALIKKLSSVETLGSTTVICTDKTGTLTQNEMTVRELWVDGKVITVGGAGYEPVGEFSADGRVLTQPQMDSWVEFFRSALLCTTSRLVAPTPDERAWRVIGDPTEAALQVVAKKAGHDIDAEFGAYPRIYLLPFESARKRMSSIHENDSRRVAHVKGSPKEILQLSTKVMLNGEAVNITSELKAQLEECIDDFARRGLRVLAIARRELALDTSSYSADSVEHDLVFLGLMAMLDPPRPEVENAVKLAHRAGIRIIMITGDYGLTAESIARKIGIIEGPATVVSGSDLDGMPGDRLRDVVTQENVIFARVASDHKMRVVEALRSRGEIVAVTGDGVNDAPALKRADIGIAMGVSGTDVAREAADMVLADDNFASIVSAIEEGRAVYDNIRRFITYIFASNIPEIVPFILFVMLGIPLPLTILQILAIDLGTDIAPALALGSEPSEPDVMDRPPRPRNKRLLDIPLITRAYLFLGPIEAAAGMAGYYFIYYQNGWRPGETLAASGEVYVLATTMVLASIVTMQIGNGFAVRTERASILKKGFLTNKFYLWGIASELVFIALIVYVPFFQLIFHTAALRYTDWLFLFLFTPTILLADETRKWIARRRRVSGRGGGHGTTGPAMRARGGHKRRAA